MQQALSSGVRPTCLARPSRAVSGRQRRTSRLLVRSVLEVDKTASSNGAAKLDVAAVESDVERELKYRLAAAGKDDQKLYQSGRRARWAFDIGASRIPDGMHLD